MDKKEAGMPPPILVGTPAVESFPEGARRKTRLSPSKVFREGKLGMKKPEAILQGFGFMFRFFIFFLFPRWSGFHKMRVPGRATRLRDWPAVLGTRYNPRIPLGTQNVKRGAIIFLWAILRRKNVIRSKFT